MGPTSASTPGDLLPPPTTPPAPIGMAPPVPGGIAPPAPPTTPPRMTLPAGGEPAGSLRRDLRTTGRNAAMLAGSVIVTTAIAMGIKILVPRVLSEEVYGRLTFADALGVVTVAVLTLGVDTYIRKEVAARPAEAPAFAPGLILVRLVVWMVLVAGCLGVLTVTGQPDQVIWLYSLWAVAYFFVGSAGINSAFLQAVQVARPISVTSIATKILWAAIIVGGLWAGSGPAIVPIALVVTELIKNLRYWVLTRRLLGTTGRVQWRATYVVVVASLPYFVQQVTGVLTGSLDIALVGFLTTDVEVGYYGVALVIWSGGLMLAPVIQWVVLPQLSRSHERSEDEMWTVFGYSLSVILALAVPAAVILALNGDLVVRYVFGVGYMPAVPALRVLALMLVLTYVTGLLATALVRLGRAWAVAVVTAGLVTIDTAINLVMIPGGLRWWGAGGAALGASISLMIAELIGTVVMAALLGRRAFPPRVLGAAALLLAAALLAAAVSQLDAVPRGLRIVLEVIILGAAAAPPLLRLVRTVRPGRRGPQATTAERGR